MMDAFNNSTQFMSHEDLTAIARVSENAVGPRRRRDGARP